MCQRTHIPQWSDEGHALGPLTNLKYSAVCTAVDIPLFRRGFASFHGHMRLCVLCHLILYPALSFLSLASARHVRRALMQRITVFRDVPLCLWVTALNVD
jgi:hypothetical protein